MDWVDIVKKYRDVKAEQIAELDKRLKALEVMG